MLFIHATLSTNLPSILEQGLLTSKATGAKPVVWLGSPSKMAWACLHIQGRHNALPTQTCVLEVDIPRTWVRKHGGSQKGLWFTDRDVPPLRIKRVLTFGLLSESPIKDEENDEG